jgi:DNA gyrase subunit A
LSEYISGIAEDEVVVAVSPMDIADGECLVILGANGLVKKLAADSVRRAKNGTTIIYDVARGGAVVGAVVCKVDDDIMIATQGGQVLRTSLSDIREVKGREAAGVAAMKVDDGDRLLGVTRVLPGGKVLTVSKKGFAKLSEADEYNAKGRGGKGVCGAVLQDGDSLLYAGVVVPAEDATLFLLTNTTQSIRISMSDVPVHGRSTRGVRLKRLDEKEEVTVASPE